MKKEDYKPLFTDFPEITTADWEEKIRTDLKGADYNKKLVWKTDEGIQKLSTIIPPATAMSTQPNQLRTCIKSCPFVR